MLWGTVLVTGSVSGFGLNLSHKLRHKQDRLGRKLALFNSALGGYGHFSIEHNLSHHRHVSAPEDPASPRLCERIYRFVLREMPSAFRRAWALQTDWVWPWGDFSYFCFIQITFLK